MKKIYLIILIMAVMSCPVFAQQIALPDDRAKITVNGDAVVYATPDKIEITLGIETQDQDIVMAKKKNNDILKKTLAAIKACGVPEKDIQTDQLSIEPRYKDEYRKENFIGFFVRNTIVVTLNKTEKVEELITNVLRAGVNYIQGIDFQTSEFKKYREQARELALKAAKEKAEKMTAVFGQTVGLPIQINENNNDSYAWYRSGWGYGRNQGMAQNAVQDNRGDPGEISGSIALGKITIKASVTVIFEIKK
jgi:hypothetical protein